MGATVRLGVPGVRVGHWTDDVGRTGCTVVLLPPATVASGEVRGGAPATREMALLDPGRLVGSIDAVLLTGGSAFGLAAADGVVRHLEAAGRGFPTSAGPVPIVVALGLFDLSVGDPQARPGPAEGEAACAAATEGPVAVGPVGAGTGATVGKWRGRERACPGGLGAATVESEGLVVSALVAVNAVGDVLPAGEEPGAVEAGGGGDPFGNTTIGVVLTNGAFDKSGCLALAQGAQDGLARAVHPPHTGFDGDAVVAASAGDVTADLERARALAVSVFAAAVRAAV